MGYQIVTDTNANIPEMLVEELGIKVISQSFFVNSVEYKSYVKGEKTDLAKFYEMMRNKEDVKTSLIGPESYADFFEEILKTGDDILYVGFSSGLSGSYQSSKIAATELSEKYPDKKIVVFDTLAAALGQGLLVYKAAKLKNSGKSMEEVLEMLEKDAPKLCHWFTVDDLFFLKRGGRISGATATFGTILNIKPVMHVDDNGKLVPVGKVRGRKQAIMSLVDKIKELGVDPENQVMAISHGDCLDEAEFMANEVKKQYGVKEIIINCLDPVIGAHAGPGTLALFFIGTER